MIAPVFGLAIDFYFAFVTRNLPILDLRLESNRDSSGCFKFLPTILWLSTNTTSFCVCYWRFPAKKTLPANARNVLKSPLLLPKSLVLAVGSLQKNHSRWNGFQKTRIIQKTSQNNGCFLPKSGLQIGPCVVSHCRPLAEATCLKGSRTCAGCFTSSRQEGWAPPVMSWFINHYSIQLL